MGNKIPGNEQSGDISPGYHRCIAMWIGLFCVFMQIIHLPILYGLKLQCSQEEIYYGLLKMERNAFLSSLDYSHKENEIHLLMIVGGELSDEYQKVIFSIEQQEALFKTFFGRPELHRTMLPMKLLFNNNHLQQLIFKDSTQLEHYTPEHYIYRQDYFEPEELRLMARKLYSRPESCHDYRTFIMALSLLPRSFELFASDEDDKEIGSAIFYTINQTLTYTDEISRKKLAKLYPKSDDYTMISELYRQGSEGYYMLKAHLDIHTEAMSESRRALWQGKLLTTFIKHGKSSKIIGEMLTTFFKTFPATIIPRYVLNDLIYACETINLRIPHDPSLELALMQVYHDLPKSHLISNSPSVARHLWKYHMWQSSSIRFDVLEGEITWRQFTQLWADYDKLEEILHSSNRLWRPILIKDKGEQHAFSTTISLLKVYSPIIWSLVQESSFKDNHQTLTDETLDKAFARTLITNLYLLDEPGMPLTTKELRSLLDPRAIPLSLMARLMRDWTLKAGSCFFTANHRWIEE